VENGTGSETQRYEQMNALVRRRRNEHLMDKRNGETKEYMEKRSGEGN